MNKFLFLVLVALIWGNYSFAQDADEEFTSNGKSSEEYQENKKTEDACPNDYQSRRISEIQEADQAASAECSDSGKLVEASVFSACGEKYVEHICIKENPEPAPTIRAR